MRILIFLIITLMTTGLELYSQGCELPTGCEDKEYPYRFCNSNNLLWRCSKDPYNETDVPTWLKPMKFDGCFEYDATTYTFEYKTTEWYEFGITEFFKVVGYIATSPYYGIKTNIPIYYPGTNNEIEGYEVGDPIFEQYETHLILNVSTEITNLSYTDFWGNDFFNFYRFNSGEYPGSNDNFDDALATWKSLCDGCELNNDYLQHCCVKISWTNDPVLFEERNFDPAIVPAYASSGMIPGSIEPCYFDCEKLKITLNQTDDFTGNSEDDPGDYDNHFFITGPTSKSGWYSLKAVLMHEMGHHFGFGDQYSTDGLDCDHTGSIMGGSGFEDPKRGLTEDDKCMYMKMYCWTPATDVEENQVIEDIYIYPNPVENFITIQSSNISETSEVAKVQIFDVLGIEVKDLTPTPLLKGEGLRINVSHLPAGVYFIRIGDKVEKFVKM